MTQPQFRPHGLWIPIITPMDRHGDIDAKALNNVARRLLADGATGLVALGTTGEPATLTHAEQDAVIDTCATVCSDRGAPLMVGVGSNCTRSTVEAARHVAERWHPAALLVVVPYYTRPSRDGIIEHYRSVAAAVDTPIIAYNVPYRAGRGLDAEGLAEIAAIDSIVGIKQAVGALDYDTLHVLAERPANFEVLAGDDAFIAPTLLLGGAGAIAAAAHVCTRLFAEMIDAAVSGKSEIARTLSAALLPVVRAGFAEPSPAVWKAALCARGELEAPAVRRPMTEATPAATTELLLAIDNASRHHSETSRA